MEFAQVLQKTPFECGPSRGKGLRIENVEIFQKCVTTIYFLNLTNFEHKEIDTFRFMDFDIQS